MDNAREISADAPGEDVFLPRPELPFLTRSGHLMIVEEVRQHRAIRLAIGAIAKQLCESALQLFQVVQLFLNVTKVFLADLARFGAAGILIFG